MLCVLGTWGGEKFSIQCLKLCATKKQLLQRPMRMNVSYSFSSWPFTGTPRSRFTRTFHLPQAKARDSQGEPEAAARRG